MTGKKISVISGRIWKLGDNCDTGQIVPGRYVPLTDPEELATHLFEDVTPDFRKKISPGDIIVAGKSFGTGSSREHAPKAIKYSGIAAVVADSFARIFYRNALNIALPVIPIPGIGRETDDGDILEIDIYQGCVTNRTKNTEHRFVPYDPFIIDMLEAGGIVEQTMNWLIKQR
jgi:3-isopropylmalate/(R)-2-methylmalate dehydratase small subunit